MKKLALKLDDLDVQSFATTRTLRELRCTVRGHLMEATYDEAACSGACSPVYSCATCETGDDACDPGGADAGRRIIVYGA
jgi:hypothetical protein